MLKSTDLETKYQGRLKDGRCISLGRRNKIYLQMDWGVGVDGNKRNQIGGGVFRDNCLGKVG